MDPISKAKLNVPFGIQQDQPTDQAAGSPTGGLSDVGDSTENAVGSVDSLREAYQAAKSEGKLLMSEGTLNHFIQNNLSPQQYPSAFSDLKGWVTNNFFLTSDQHTTINALSNDDVGKIQTAGATAAKLNVPLSIQFRDAEPSATGPKQITFREPVLDGGVVLVKGDCTRQLNPAEDLANFQQPITPNAGNLDDFES
jgi:hypothetical protein